MKQGSVSARILGLAQKAADFADYVYHRALMKTRYQANRIRHQWLFRNHVPGILIVRLGSIGDVVRATAVVGRLRERYPSSRIDFLTTEAALPVIGGHPALDAVHTLADLSRLERYDWIVNLQNRDPAESFLRGSGLSYSQILAHLSTRLGHRLFSGRRLKNGRESTPTNILYCVAEMEELMLIALLDYDPAAYPRTEIQLDDSLRSAVDRKFAIPSGRPRLGIFLGSNSVGCGADEGFRTYSIPFIERLIRQFEDRFTVVVIGQSSARNPAELVEFRSILTGHPDVISLVDKTSLDELVAVIDELDVLITCDSSPIHIAMARNVPAVGLYVNDASYRLSPKLEHDRVVALNSEPPCFYYSWRWKFFCSVCRDRRTRAYYCRDQVFAFGVDRIPIERIDAAARQLVARAGGGRPLR